MAGYNGYSMSNNAVTAYENGEMPLSKWTKREIIFAISNINTDVDENLVKKLTKQTLQDEFLSLSSWHHTSKFYNQTNFYEIDEEAVEELTNEKLKEMIEEQNEEKAYKKSWTRESLRTEHGFAEFRINKIDGSVEEFRVVGNALKYVGDEKAKKHYEALKNNR